MKFKLFLLLPLLLIGCANNTKTVTVENKPELILETKYYESKGSSKYYLFHEKTYDSFVGSTPSLKTDVAYTVQYSFVMVFEHPRLEIGDHFVYDIQYNTYYYSFI